MKQYTIIIEAGERNYSAYAPDLPGCIATGKTRDETVANMRAAIEQHLEVMRELGIVVPEPTTSAQLVDVAG